MFPSKFHLIKLDIALMSPMWKGTSSHLSIRVEYEQKSENINEYIKLKNIQKVVAMAKSRMVDSMKKSNVANSTASLRLKKNIGMKWNKFMMKLSE